MHIQHRKIQYQMDYIFKILFSVFPSSSIYVLLGTIYRQVVFVF